MARMKNTSREGLSRGETGDVGWLGVNTLSGLVVYFARGRFNSNEVFGNFIGGPLGQDPQDSPSGVVKLFTLGQRYPHRAGS